MQKSIYITGYLVSTAPSGIAGNFVLDDSDTASADNGGTIITDASGRRWKRQYSDRINVSWFEIGIDASPAIQSAVNVAISHQINRALIGSTVAVSISQSIVLPSGNFRVNSVIIANGLGCLTLISDGKSVIIGDTSLTKGINFLNGSSLRYLNVKGIQFQNFNSVFTASNGNADLSLWKFESCQAAGVNLFIDTVSYALSRSTQVAFRDCVFQYNCVRVARAFCDLLTFHNCWIGSDTNSTDSIYTNSNISFYGCMFVPSGATSVGRSLVKLTNDNGAGGVANDASRGVTFNGCRASNEGGQGPLVVCDFPVVNVVDTLTPTISFYGCDLVGYHPSAYEEGNTESGIVYLRQYPASVSFHACGLAAVGAANGKVVAKSDALVSAAPGCFNIFMDEPSFKSATWLAGVTSNATVAASLRQYINNPDPYTFRGIFEGGYLDVVDSTTTGKKMATFSINTGYTDSDYATPIAFFLYLSGQGQPTNNDIAYQSSSIYLVTINGYYDTSAKSRITYTKLHGDSYGLALASNADIVSFHFGGAETGIGNTARSKINTVTVAFGSNVLNGKARIEPMFKKFSRFGSQPT